LNFAEVLVPAWGYLPGSYISASDAAPGFVSVRLKASG
jgi:hypothetical protein